MATFNIPSAQITANVVATSPSARPNTNFHTITVTLTNPNGDYPDTPDNTRHIKQWGFQQSQDNVTWTWGPVYAGRQDDSATWIAFGTHPKNDPAQMPGVAMTVDNLGDANTRLRLAILTDADIRLGATIVVT